MSKKLMTILLVTALLVSVGLLFKTGCQQQDLQSANDQLNRELMQSDLELGRALTKFGDAEDYISELDSKVKEEIKARKGQVKMYAELHA